MPAALAAPQPWTFTVDSLAMDLRVSLDRRASGTPSTPSTPGTSGEKLPVLLQPDHHLVLATALPMDVAVLRASNMVFAPITTDTGERLGLLLRPANRTQSFAVDHAFNRDRQLKITLDLTPPWRPCARLIGLTGAVTLTVASGKRREGAMRATVGSVVRAEGIGSASLTESSAKSITLVLSRDLADRLSGISARDAGDQELPGKPRELTRDLATVKLALDVATERCERVVVSWFPDLEDRRIAVSIPAIEIPGGMPGIGALAEAVPAFPASPPASPKAPVLKLPLHLAIVAGDASEVARLIDHGADREAMDADGRRPLHRAVALGQAEVVRALIERKVDVDARARDGSSALQLAAGSIGMTSALIAAGAKVGGVAPGNGWTALHSAVAAGDAASVTALIAAGADPAATAKDGRSSLDLARDQGRWRLLRAMLGNPD